MMPDPAESEALALALLYAGCGLRVLPIKPGTKRPPMKEWVQAATTDIDIIRNWFTEPLYRDHGVGLAMGRQPDGRMIFALDVDEHNPAHSGFDTLADLQAEHGQLPDTVCSITGSGGMHLLFAAPADVEVRNGVAGDGIDVRGEGGQIVVAPSTHPTTGGRYEWEANSAPWECTIAAAPGWVLDLVCAPPPASTPATATSTANPPLQSALQYEFTTPETPAEWLRERWDWQLQLTDAGWVEHHVERNGDTHWTRPGKDRREGASAILHMPDGPLVVFSTDASMTGLHAVGHVNRDGSVSVTPFEFYAAQRHHGDLSSAGRAINTMMNPTDSRLAATVEQPDEHPLARYLEQELVWESFWQGNHAGENWVASPLIPAGRLVALYAPAKQGKSEVALAVVAALATGKPILGQRNHDGPRHVVYLDYEMTQADLWERLELLGYSADDDWSHLHYYPLPSLPPLDTEFGSIVLRGIARERQAEVVVIDTMGRAVEGDENSNDTYRAFARFTGLGLKSDEVAVVRTDHAGKDKEKGQRGASAKNDDADVVFRVERVEGGWKLDRTHTRVSWVPEQVVIDRTDQGDGTVKIELSSTSTASTYLHGTADYVAELQAAGVTVTHQTKTREFYPMVRAVGLGRTGRAMNDAMKWMKTMLPDFTAGPTPIEPTSELGPDPDSRLSDDTPALDDIR